MKMQSATAGGTPAPITDPEVCSCRSGGGRPRRMRLARAELPIRVPARSCAGDDRAVLAARKRSRSPAPHRQRRAARTAPPAPRTKPAAALEVLRVEVLERAQVAMRMSSSSSMRFLVSTAPSARTVAFLDQALEVVVLLGDRRAVLQLQARRGGRDVRRRFIELLDHRSVACPATARPVSPRGRTPPPSNCLRGARAVQLAELDHAVV